MGVRAVFCGQCFMALTLMVLFSPPVLALPPSQAPERELGLLAQAAGKNTREQTKTKKPAGPEIGAKTQGDWFERAIALEKAKDWQELVEHSRRWTQAKPDDPLAFNTLGIAYSKLDRHQEAVEAFQESLRRQPSPNAWNHLGNAYRALGRPQEAVQPYREALRLRPDSAEFNYNLGLSYLVQVQTQEAIEAFKEALRLRAAYPEALSALSGAYIISGNNRGAAETLSALALVHYLSGNRHAALEAVKELRQYDPQKADEISNTLR
jgi:tetratricopeptide (TPR) repeat protein